MTLRFKANEANYANKLENGAADMIFFHQQMRNRYFGKYKR